MDDDQESAASIKDLLERRPVSSSGDQCKVETTNDFNSALRILEKEQYDLLILDIRDQGMAARQGISPDGDAITAADLGLTAYTEVTQRRFIPIVFHTALPDLASDLESPPFTAVVSKLDPDEARIRRAVVEAFDSGLPELNRALIRHVESIHREFMSEFVQKNWNTFEGKRHQGDLAHLLVRRLAISLADGAPVLFPYLESSENHKIHGDKVHPMRMYLLPPADSWTTGDILQYTDQPPESFAEGAPGDGPSATQEASAQYWVTLTPACDLVEERRKADYIVMARCLPLEESPEYLKWSSRSSTGETATAAAQKSMQKLIANNRDGQRERYFFLPAAWDLPNLIVDFQQIIHVEYENVRHARRLGTLDSPYSQSLISQFTRYLGRMGTPDLSIETVIQRLESSLITQVSRDDSPT
ncbi:hypothetical protein [Streptomyces sp. NPDC001759]